MYCQSSMNMCIHTSAYIYFNYISSCTMWCHWITLQLCVRDWQHSTSADSPLCDSQHYGIHITLSALVSAISWVSRCWSTRDNIQKYLHLEGFHLPIRHTHYSIPWGTDVWRGCISWGDTHLPLVYPRLTVCTHSLCTKSTPVVGMLLVMWSVCFLLTASNTSVLCLPCQHF